MKKLLFSVISVLLLASCAPKVPPTVINIPTSSPTQSTDITVSPSFNSPSTSPSSTALPSSTDESVSEGLNTADLKKFFTLTSEELCTLLGSDFEDSYVDYLEDTITYANLGVSYEYGFNFDDKNIIMNFSKSTAEPVMSLHRIIFSSFSFRGLNSMSDFEDVISMLGSSKLLVLHNDKGYYYALRYTFSTLMFEFSSVDQIGSGSITLSVMPSSDSEVFYTSGGEGDNVSKALTTGDIKLFLELAPEGLDSLLGNGTTGFDEDTGLYFIHFNYLGLHFAYSLEEVQQGEEMIIYPVLPLEYIRVDDFEYRGLSQNSTFKDVIRVLGQSEVLEIPIVDTSYYSLQYRIDGILFNFSSSNSEASDGVGLSMKLDNK